MSRIVLKRKLGESIVIGNDVTITLTEIHSTSVRIRIDAPRETIVLRGELVASLPTQPQEVAEVARA